MTTRSTSPSRAAAARRLGSVTVAVAIVADLFVGAPGAVGDTGNPPDLVRTLGGPSHAEMYPSGMEVAPDGSIVIADTGNNQVAKYTEAGRELWRIGRKGTGRNRFSDPRDIGIDARGRIYVADARNERIVKLAKDGTWLKSFRGPRSSRMGVPIGVTVRDGLVYVADTSSKKKIRVFDLSGEQVRAIRDPGSGRCDLAQPRDIDADPQGNLYVANYTLHNVVKLSRRGACRDAWPTGTLSSNTPYGIRLARDPVLDTRLVYVALGNENTIEVYRRSGAKVGTIGGFGPPSEPGKFTELRRVAVAEDGDVWGADLWGWRVERFNRTPTGWTYAQRIGDPLPAPTADHVFQEPHQVAFWGDGDLAIVDTVHHRLVFMTPEGQIIKTCGQRGGGRPGLYNWPRGVAVDPALGGAGQTHFWVANTKQYNIHVVRSDTCAGAPPVPGGGPGAVFGSQGNGNGRFNWPHSIVITSNRIAFIADTINHRIVAYDVAMRTQVGRYGSPNGNELRFPSAVALSPVTGNLFVSDKNHNRIVELAVSADGTSFNPVETYRGGFRRPQGVAVDPNGRIYVADTGHDRMVVLQEDGDELGTVTGLHGPEAVSVDPDTGLIYLSDTYADRVRVYAYGP